MDESVAVRRHLPDDILFLYSKLERHSLVQSVRVLSLLYITEFSRLKSVHYTPRSEVNINYRHLPTSEPCLRKIHISRCEKLSTVPAHNPVHLGRVVCGISVDLGVDNIARNPKPLSWSRHVHIA